MVPVSLEIATKIVSLGFDAALESVQEPGARDFLRLLFDVTATRAKQAIQEAEQLEVALIRLVPAQLMVEMVTRFDQGTLPELGDVAPTLKLVLARMASRTPPEGQGGAETRGCGEECSCQEESTEEATEAATGCTLDEDGHCAGHP